MRGKRFALAAELADSTILSDDMVKRMTSTDKIHAEKKYRDEYEFTPSHTLVLYTNYLPKVKSTDEGIWRRLVVVPFNAVIKPADVKLDFAQILFDESAPAIMKWIVEGAKRVIANHGRIELPRCVREAVAAYRAANDWLSQFIEECCTKAPSSWISKKAMYDTYKKYAGETQGFTRRKVDFELLLKDVPGIYEDVDSHTKSKIWRGITVKPSELPSEPLPFPD